jgi:SSS family solute:Na+ symporter
LPILSQVDWLIILLYFFCVLAIGFSVRSNIKTGKDFFEAGRSLPGWICAVAFIAASLGSQEVIAMGAAGARYGLRVAVFFSLGAIPAILFAGVFMMPLFYGSGARTAPEYLWLRFDQKTRLLNACMFAITTIAGAGISLFAMGRVFQALHIFDALFYAHDWPRQGIFGFCVVLFAATVLVYVLVAGLAGAMVNQTLQFVLMVAGLLPMVLVGLKNIGGWSGLKAAAAVAAPAGLAHGGAMTTAAIGLLLGFVLSAGRWTTDFRILQTAMAAKNLETARRIPLFAAAARLALPLLLIVPGAIAIGLPTPQNATVVRNANGAIYHEITVVPRETAEGRGRVPARLDTATGEPLLDSGGHTRLNYDMATPGLLGLLPRGLLGLGVAALLASLMSGFAASVAALMAVVTRDVYEPCVGKSADLVAVGRWAALGGVALSVGVAFAIHELHGSAGEGALAALLLVGSLGIAPQVATFLLGMFTKRASADGAFAGLVAGLFAAVLHYGLTLSADTQRGIYGGWIAVAHRYSGLIAQCFWTAVFGLGVNVVVAVAVSLRAKARPEKELKGLVYSLRVRSNGVVWWKRPEAMAAAILLAAVGVGVWVG